MPLNRACWGTADWQLLADTYANIWPDSQHGLINGRHFHHHWTMDLPKLIQLSWASNSFRDTRRINSSNSPPLPFLEYRYVLIFCFEVHHIINGDQVNICANAGFEPREILFLRQIRRLRLPVTPIAGRLRKLTHECSDVGLFWRLGRTVFDYLISALESSDR